MPHPSTSSAYGIWSLNEVRDAERGDNWPTTAPDNPSYFIDFEGSTIADSVSITGADPSISILTSNGSLVSTDSPFAGSKHLYNDTRSSPANRVLFGIPATTFNSYRYFTCEFYFKLSAQDNFPSMFEVLGGNTTNEIILIRANRNGVGAANIGGTGSDDTTTWCTWTNYNKFNIEIDTDSPSNNATIYVNDVAQATGTVPQTWTAQSGVNIYLSLYQRAAVASSDNGVEGWFDNFKIEFSD